MFSSPNCLYHEHKSGFANASPNGYYYDTDTLTFMSPNDRTLAINTLISTFRTQGTTYTSDQLSHLTDSFIISILEPDSDAEFASLKSQMVILTDPNYFGALTSVNTARNSNMSFQNDQQRTMVYNLLSNYFTSINTPITQPQAQWSDMLLIQAFTTLRLPDPTQFTDPSTPQASYSSEYQAAIQQYNTPITPPSPTGPSSGLTSDSSDPNQVLSQPTSQQAYTDIAQPSTTQGSG